jgi:hypothetical protein
MAIRRDVQTTTDDAGQHTTVTRSCRYCDYRKDVPIT